jgi:hypothetical protein
MNLVRLIIIAGFLSSILQISYASECKKASIVNFHRGFSNIKIPPAPQPFKLENASDNLKNAGEKIEFYSVKTKKYSTTID